jgi:hypothetical protein
MTIEGNGYMAAELQASALEHAGTLPEAFYAKLQANAFQNSAMQMHANNFGIMPSNVFLNVAHAISSIDQRLVNAKKYIDMQRKNRKGRWIEQSRVMEYKRARVKI